jgi:NADH-quinone oxidoreductase subunit H
MLLILLTWLIQGLLVLLSVAFFTLFERKVMGLFHLRLGPVKVSFIGLFQPLLDAFKLLTKTPLTPHHTNSVGYSLSPVFSLTLSIFLWATLPGVVNYLRIGYSFVLFFVIGSVIVLFVLLGG